MNKILVFVFLFTTFIAYTSWVYTNGTNRASTMTTQQQLGKKIWQDNNCQSCHQIFGLGGYLGPELTTGYGSASFGVDSAHYETYARTILQYGSIRMPNFHLTPQQINAIIDYLKYVDANAFSYRKNYKNEY